MSKIIQDPEFLERVKQRELLAKMEQEKWRRFPKYSPGERIWLGIALISLLAVWFFWA